MCISSCLSYKLSRAARALLRNCYEIIWQSKCVYASNIEGIAQLLLSTGTSRTLAAALFGKV